MGSKVVLPQLLPLISPFSKCNLLSPKALRTQTRYHAHRLPQLRPRPAGAQGGAVEGLLTIGPFGLRAPLRPRRPRPPLCPPAREAQGAVRGGLRRVPTA